MDTIKDKQELDAIVVSGDVPWRRPRGVAVRLMLGSRPRCRHPADRRVLVIGCHADDIEIGCGGDDACPDPREPALEVTWVVLAAPGSARPKARLLPRRSCADAGARLTSAFMTSATASFRTSVPR